MRGKTSPVEPALSLSKGTTENAPGRQSWVNLTARECCWQSSKANPILLESHELPYHQRITWNLRPISSLIWIALAENIQGRSPWLPHPCCETQASPEVLFSLKSPQV